MNKRDNQRKILKSGKKVMNQFETRLKKQKAAGWLGLHTQRKQPRLAFPSHQFSNKKEDQIITFIP